MSINVLEDQRLVSVVGHNSPTSTESSNVPNYSWSAESILHHQLGLSCLDDDEVLALMALSPAERKHQGVFFTPAELSKLAVEKFGYSLNEGAILDPACGSGNLLAALAATLEVLPSLEATLAEWNSRLHGIDINSDFVNIAKKKLVKLALSKGAVPSGEKTPKEILSILSNIKAGDFLKEYKSYCGKIGGVIMNPPFCHIEANNEINWTSGKFNAASLFVIYATEILAANGKFLGILPDVLRSGTRYAQWRSLILKKTECTMETFGNFEPGVQVDVFILQGKINHTQEEKNAEQVAANETPTTLLMDEFNVSVGPVVPHRDKVTGIEAPFAHAKILPAWETVDFLPERICHAGRKVQPPFIAVRRTSSPKDRFRVVGTVVNCSEPVAVENHIIILSPKDRSLLSCQRTLELLKTEHVNNYINSKIRCRHLTVGIIKGIPIGRAADGN
ncbi:hypothetical protein IPC412_02435 [Pseudomonas aeruginosa]|uniref:N-6 DNA methylase n=1 Tax=Pseudomonas aeruginosa TaxID=287 RepID=UPI000FC4198B|nr:N-6 DNA methylase [Pseudomonas aeruginosa]RUI92873.1 hypothetical protein IPC412_02435 [Pseudomonas aeruginosa]RUJ38036.1 hypothetical protein IPC357_07220 [Pseudomonas aeruginosa]